MVGRLFGQSAYPIAADRAHVPTTMAPGLIRYVRRWNIGGGAGHVAVRSHGADTASGHRDRSLNPCEAGWVPLRLRQTERGSSPSASPSGVTDPPQIGRARRIGRGAHPTDRRHHTLTTRGLTADVRGRACRRFRAATASRQPTPQGMEP